MVIIRILDHVELPSGYEEGEIIYKILHKKLQANEMTTVSFDGISAVPSAFINAAFIRLLDDISFDAIKKNLTFVNSTKYINTLIRDRFTFVSNERKIDK